MKSEKEEKEKNYAFVCHQFTVLCVSSMKESYLIEKKDILMYVCLLEEKREFRAEYSAFLYVGLSSHFFLQISSPKLQIRASFEVIESPSNFVKCYYIRVIQMSKRKKEQSATRTTKRRRGNT